MHIGNKLKRNLDTETSLKLIKERYPSQYKHSKILYDRGYEFSTLGYCPVINNHLEVMYRPDAKLYIVWNLHYSYRNNKDMRIFQSKSLDEIIGFIRGYTFKSKRKKT